MPAVSSDFSLLACAYSMLAVCLDKSMRCQKVLQLETANGCFVYINMFFYVYSNLITIYSDTFYDSYFLFVRKVVIGSKVETPSTEGSKVAR